MRRMDRGKWGSLECVWSETRDADTWRRADEYDFTRLCASAVGATNVSSSGLIAADSGNNYAGSG